MTVRDADGLAASPPRPSRAPRGSLVPLVTPFKEGAIDEEAFRALVDWQIESGTHGLVIGGTTGEPAALSPQERRRVLQVAVQQAAGRVPVIAGTGSANLDETLALTAFAADVGADAVLVVVPYYVRPTQEGLYAYFREVARHSRLPVILYNIPGRAAQNLEVDTLLRLRRDCPTIVGVKEANKDFEQAVRILARCDPDFAVYSGVEMLCFPLLALGGAGYVSATGNVAPAELARMYELAVQGRWEEARAIHHRLVPLNEALFLETNPVPAKTALAMMGRIRPEVRMPLAPMQPANRRRLEEVLAALGLVGPGASVAKGAPAG